MKKVLENRDARRLKGGAQKKALVRHHQCYAVLYRKPLSLSRARLSFCLPSLFLCLFSLALCLFSPSSLPHTHLCVVRSQTMHDPSDDALTASSDPEFLTAMQLTGPLWSFRDASITATPLDTRHTRTMPEGGGGELACDQRGRGG